MPQCEWIVDQPFIFKPRQCYRKGTHEVNGSWYCRDHPGKTKEGQTGVESGDIMDTELKLRQVCEAITKWSKPIHHYAGFCSVCGADEEIEEHRSLDCPVKLAQEALDYLNSDMVQEEVWEVGMRLDVYQEEAFSTAVYENKGANLEYVGLGLGGETGEILDIFKRVVGRGEELDSRKLLLELGDGLWYTAGVVTECEERLSTVIGVDTFFDFQQEIRKVWYAKLSVARLCLLLGATVGKIQDAILLTTHPERPIDHRVDILIQVRIYFEYLGAIGQIHNLTLTEIARENLKKLRDRKTRGVLRGSGDDR